MNILQYIYIYIYCVPGPKAHKRYFMTEEKIYQHPSVLIMCEYAVGWRNFKSSTFLQFSKFTNCSRYGIFLVRYTKIASLATRACFKNYTYCICVTNVCPCHRHSDPLDHKTADDADGATEAEADEIEADNPMCRASLGVEATEANAVYRQLGHHADACSDSSVLVWPFVLS